MRLREILGSIDGGGDAVVHRVTRRSGEAQRGYSLVLEMTYNWCIVIHLAEELAQACFLLGGFWRGGHGILARRGGVRVRFGLILGVHIDVFFDGNIKIRLSFDVIFRFGRRGMLL